MTMADSLWPMARDTQGSHCGLDPQSPSKPMQAIGHSDPTTKTTETLNYNDRLIIADRDNEPPTFHISKVEDMYPIGVTKFTLAQEHFDPTRDNAELKIADYYSSNISPEKEESIVKRSEILLSSKTPNLILGG